VQQNRKWFWIGAALFLPGILLGQDHGLWRREEARNVEIAREMFVSGNWAAPTFNEETFLEKPPLVYASVALTFFLAGQANDDLARIPSTLFVLLGLLGAILLGRRLGGEGMGLWTGLILSSNILYFIYAHQCSLDLPLATLITWSLFCFYRVYEPDKPAYSLLEVLPIYFFATLAFYAKGFLGLVMPGLAIITFLIWMRDFRGLWRIKPGFGALIFIVLTTPWFYELWRQGGLEYFKFFFLDNHLYRFLNTAQSDLGHQTRPSWYLEIIWHFFSPWSWLLVPTGVLFFRRSFRQNFSGPGRRFILSWFLTSFIFLSIASTKREPYLLSVLPAASLAVAAWIQSRRGDDPGPLWEQGFAWAFALFLLIFSIGLPVYCALNPGAGQTWALGFLPPALLAAGAAVYFLARRNRPRFYAWAFGAMWVLTLTTALFYLPIISSEEDPSRICAQVTRLTRPSRVIYTLEPAKMDIGYLGFYSGLHVEDLVQQKDLAELALSPSPIYVAIVGRKSRNLQLIPNYVNKRGARLKLLAREPFGAERVSALWRLYPAPAGTNGGSQAPDSSACGASKLRPLPSGEKSSASVPGLGG
jgi:4-amino-4-deoxy-L-arabinose transferase-like glycosyltransferase